MPFLYHELSILYHLLRPASHLKRSTVLCRIGAASSEQTGAILIIGGAPVLFVFSAKQGNDGAHTESVTCTESVAVTVNECGLPSARASSF
jgi:hypothetical protein